MVSFHINDVGILIIIIIIMLILSGIFSGLDLGLMGISIEELDIFISDNNNINSKYALLIKPIRKKSNWLLCTLLFGNVICNTTIAILITSYFNYNNNLISFIITTIIIFLFGEIIPQTIILKYSLYISYKLRFIIYFFMYLFSILTYPISIILNYILGYEFENTLSNKELQKLIDINTIKQKSNMNMNE